MATRPRRNDRRLGDWRTHYEQIWMPMTPTKPIDRMTLVEFVVARQTLRDALAKFPDPICHNCRHFSMGWCDQFGEVPADFQKTPEACEAWSFENIPF